MYSDDSSPAKGYTDVLARDDISAVIIALPIVTQPTFIETALRAGKHVLAEKPVGPDIARAKNLIDYYHRVSTGNNATLAIAENLRFYPSIAYASEQLRMLGKVTQFSVKVMSLVSQHSKWYNTEWRKKPDYQGGFLLDGGVHYAAATRLLLGRDDAPSEVQAFTDRVQHHLVPIDTVVAIIKTRRGATGTFQLSEGSLMEAFEWEVACERGTVKLTNETVTVVKQRGSERIVKEFERTRGVGEEVRAWAQSIRDGKPSPLQLPEEALADVEFVEKMFRSSEQGGARKRYERL